VDLNFAAVFLAALDRCLHCYGAAYNLPGNYVSIEMSIWKRRGDGIWVYRSNFYCLLCLLPTR
jgi:hypothetical protein